MWANDLAAKPAMQSYITFKPCIRFQGITWFHTSTAGADIKRTGMHITMFIEV